MMSMRRLQVLTALPVAAALFGITGCGGDTASAKASDPTEEAAQAVTLAKSAGTDDKAAPADCGGGEEGARAHHGGHGGPGAGPEHLLRAALHELVLSDAQKATIEAALAKGAPGPRDRGPEDRPAMTALAASVRAGKIDATAALAQVGAPEDHAAATATALDTLHATLTPEQRRALVDAVAKRMADHGPDGERFGKGGPMGHLLDGLSLTDAQRTSIDAALAAQRPAPIDREAMKTEMRARLQSFAADSFDAKAFVAPPANAPQGKPRMHPMARRVNELAVIVPLLDATQRETLAAQLEKAPSRP